MILGDVPFFIPPSPVSQFLFGEDAKSRDLLLSVGGDFTGGLVPISVIATNNSMFDDDALDSILEGYKSKDDVWNVSFLAGKYSIPELN